MQVSACNNFICPIDGLPIFRNARSLKCGKGHGYDLAKEGYYNLLLVQQKATLDPGDNKEMVAARRRFLDLGRFSPIADKVFELIREIVIEKKRDEPLNSVPSVPETSRHLYSPNELEMLNGIDAESLQRIDEVKRLFNGTVVGVIDRKP